MISRDLLKEFPTKRIKPEDGMAVTAQAWEAAHEFHRQRLRFHDLLRHGPGILTGLDVIASEPADSTVYVLPGIAVDPCGEAIALTAPMAYDLGSAHGLLHLLLTYEETHHPLRPGREDDLPTIDCQFGIEATVALPQDPYVELARVRRAGQGTVVTDARDPLHPVVNELDLRYRSELAQTQQQVVSIGVSYLGAGAGKTHGQGVDNLASALRQSGQRVWVDDNVPIEAGLGAYTLLYLVGQDAFELVRDEMIALNAYLQGGGTVLFESCRAASDGQEPRADTSFTDLLASLGIQLGEVPRDHELLLRPHLFATPPPGFETESAGGGAEGSHQVRVADGVILSRRDYGCLWKGERRGRLASRDEIRTAIEWGDNIVAYALHRRQRTGAK